MKKQKTFQQFNHDEIELKNALIEEARELGESERFSGKLASAMIYSSVAEYLAEHLLENLNYLVYKSTHAQYAAIIYIDERAKSNKLTLGQMARSLNKYNFPDKNEIISSLNAIATSRNHLFHNLAKTPAESWSSLEDSISNISLHVEELIEKTNIVYAGLRKILLPQDEEQVGTTKATSKKK